MHEVAIRDPQEDMPQSDAQYILTLSCLNRPGIVAVVASGIVIVGYLFNALFA